MITNLLEINLRDEEDDDEFIMDDNEFVIIDQPSRIIGWIDYGFKVIGLGGCMNNHLVWESEQKFNNLPIWQILRIEQKILKFI